MATQMLSNAMILVNAVDLSDHLVQSSIAQTIAALDAKAMGVDTEIKKPGLKAGSFKMTFLQDFAAGKVDATINPLYSAGTTFTIEVRPTNGARSATNPAYTATVFVSEYNPIAGSVGDMHKCDVTFELAGSVSRLTA